jgi:hypothetical protein
MYQFCFNRKCVHCRTFNKGEEKDMCAQECSHFNLTKVESLDKVSQTVQVDPMTHCKEKVADECLFYFTYSMNGKSEAIVHVVETPGKSLIMSQILLIFFYALFLPCRPMVRFHNIHQQIPALLF